MHHFFRQNFSQVTNPPIDSLRERRVMTLKTRLGNLGNILDEDEAQLRLLQLESPVLSNAEFDAMVEHMGERSEEHTSELQSLMRISYAVFCLKKKTIYNILIYSQTTRLHTGPQTTYT